MSRPVRSRRRRWPSSVRGAFFVWVLLLATSSPAAAHPYADNNHGAFAQAALAGQVYTDVVGLKGRPHVHAISGVLIGSFTVAANLRPMQVVAQYPQDTTSGRHEFAAVGYLDGCLKNGAGCSGTFNSATSYNPRRRMYTDYIHVHAWDGIQEYHSHSDDILATDTDPWLEVHHYVSTNACGTGRCWETLINGSFRRRWDTGLIKGFALAGSENSAPSSAAGWNTNITMDMTEVDFTGLHVARETVGWHYWPNAVGHSPHGGGVCWVEAPYGSQGNFGHIRVLGRC
jgi:hypothetical protein